MGDANTQIGPFLGTVVATLLMTLHMVLGPFRPLKKLMQLTKTRWDFQLFMILLGVTYFVVAWVSETVLFPWLARMFGTVKQAVTKRQKQRKQYKVIQEGIRM